MISWMESNGDKKDDDHTMTRLSSFLNKQKYVISKKKRNYSPHDELLNLSSDGGGEIFHKLNIARDLEVRKLATKL